MFNEPHQRLAPQSAPHLSTGAIALPPLRVGMIGLGTVGGGTLAVLARNQARIAARAGRRIEVVAVAVRNTAKARQLLGAGAHATVELCDDPLHVATHPQVDVLVEVAGGTDAARDWALAALAHGKHVVTANKALLAVHGNALFSAAAQHQRLLAYEAAVAGSVPIIKTLREALAGNRVESVVGVINGTSNYILTRMQQAGLGFDAALAEAQALGYAEADPQFDIDGTDAAHKLCLLAANAFGLPVQLGAVHIEGLQGLHSDDITAAAAWGLGVKLLASARRVPGHDAVELRVHPALLPAHHPLAQLGGVTNGVQVCSDAAGTAFYSGAGAGAEPTASAVVADLVDIARHLRRSAETPETLEPLEAPALLDAPDSEPTPHVLPMAAVQTRHFLRLLPGQTLCEAQAVRVLARHGIHITRRGWGAGTEAGAPALQLLTGLASEQTLQSALADLRACTDAEVHHLRAEFLED